MAPEQGRADIIPAVAAPAPGTVDLAFLLSMNYDEARKLSGQSLDLGGLGRVAAESIEVLKTDRAGRPKKVRAKGKVYLETGSGDAAKVLCQEAYFSGGEIVLRGRPILQRGASIFEGLADDTVFYLFGTRLRAIGLHRLTNPDAMIEGMPDLGPWQQGPNPLLPALDEYAVPEDVRQEMLRAAEAELLLQRHRDELLDLSDPAAPPPAVRKAH